MPFSLTGALSAPPDKCPLWVESGHSLHYDRAIEYQPQTKGDTTGRRPRSSRHQRTARILISGVRNKLLALLPSTRCPLAQSDQIIAPQAHVDPHQRTHTIFSGFFADWTSRQTQS